MRLLITTQIVDQNEPSLGFFHRWLVEFAKHVESIEVICLYEGSHSLPENVHVHSLGKKTATQATGIMERMVHAGKFLWLVITLRKKYDKVFVHMNPEYIVLAGLWWKMTHKTIGLWYLHKSVDMKLRVATFFADVVFTASTESFRLQSPKVQIVGHGIDTSLFSCEQKNSGAALLRLVTIGRIAPSKNLHTLVDAVSDVSDTGMHVQFDIIGAPARLSDTAYEDDIKKRSGAVAEKSDGKSSVQFLGTKTQEEIASLLCGYDLFIHASTGTGSVDKAVLEALACGVPVVSSSEAFAELLQPYGLFVANGSAAGIADAIRTFAGLPAEEKSRIAQALKETVVAQYSLEALIPRILTLLHP